MKAACQLVGLNSSGFQIEGATFRLRIVFVCRVRAHLDSTVTFR